MKSVILFISLFFGGLCLAQPSFNNWYDCNRDQTVYRSVLSTDSCYYFTGNAKSELNPGGWDVVISKISLNGDVISDFFISNDTASLICQGTQLIETVDNNFALLTTYDQHFMFFKLSESGQVLDSVLIDTLMDYHDMYAIVPSKIFQNPVDSNFICMALVQNIITLDGNVVLFELSQNLDLNFFKLFDSNHPDYYAMYPCSIMKESDGYLLSTNIVKLAGGTPDAKGHTVFIKTDFQGNEISRWTNWQNDIEDNANGFVKTLDNGYIVCGRNGEYITENTGYWYKPRIAKFDQNFNEEWKITFKDSSDWLVVNCMDIIKKSESRFVANGNTFVDSMIVGWMIEFDLQGQVIWDSYFSYVPFQEGFGSSTFPDHYLYHMDQTPDGGFVNVGAAFDVYLNMQSQPSYFAWAFKTDSVGCLVPGCQDFLSSEPEPDATTLEIYPNPASDQVYIYFEQMNFQKGKTAQIIDSQGRLIQTFDMHSSNMNYILNVSNYESGVYTIQVESDENRLSRRFVVSN